MTDLRLHGLSDTPNTTKALVVAAIAGVSVDTVAATLGKTNKAADFVAKFPFGKVPALETEHGPVFESNAIAHYIAAAHAPALLGAGPYQQALVVQWICSADCELLPAVSRVIYPLLGYASFDAAEHKAAIAALMEKLAIYDGVLAQRTFLVGERLGLADIVVACSLQRTFALVLDASMRMSLPHLTRWFLTVTHQAAFLQVVGEPTLAETCAQKPVASACKACPAAGSCGAAPKAAPAPACNDDDDEEDEPKPAKKSENPLDLLPKSQLNLEEWKRVYSNAKETRPDATTWFWNKWDPEGYSIWRADYRYPEELKKIFMSCNLVTGLFARMELLRRYCFASVCIFGEDDKNEISGVFVFRGKEIPELMKEVPDFESYTWTRMDVTDAAQRELFEDYLAWEGKFEGRKFADGKIFK